MINTLSRAIIMINVQEKLSGKNAEKYQTKENTPTTTPISHINNSTDIIGILNKPKPISEQLSMIKILSALAFCLFLIFCSIIYYLK